MGKGGGGGGGQPQTTTAYQTNLPEYAKPYVMNMLGAAQNQLFTTSGDQITGFRPYQPYSTDPTQYFAAPTGLQQQVYGEAAGMRTPGSFGAAQGLAGISGARALGAGQQFARGVTDPSQVGAFMSPYQQGVTDVAKAAAIREAQMADRANRLSAARQGTYGGARETLGRIERERNLLANLSNIQAQGSQAAYDRAMQNMQFGANLGLQGLGQATGAASALGQLGGAQQQADLARMGFQQQTGAAQQQFQQNIINQAIQDYATAQQYPLMQLSAMSSLLRGLPLQSATTQTYQAAPSVTSQLAGLGTAGVGAYGLGRATGIFKEGGQVKGYKYGGVPGMTDEKLKAMANKLTKDQLEAQLRDPTLEDDERQIFTAELREKSRGLGFAPAQNMENLAGGGIVAFAEGDLVDDEEDDDSTGVGYAGQDDDAELVDDILARGIPAGAYGRGIVAAAPTGQGIRPEARAPRGLDPDTFVQKIMARESGGRRYDKEGKLLTSSKGAEGEMQVMPKTQRDPGFGVRPARDDSPDEIARVGRDYATMLLTRYEDPKVAAIAYNWGPGNTDKWLAQGADMSKLPKETQKYIRNLKAGGAIRFQNRGIVDELYGYIDPETGEPYKSVNPLDVGRIARGGKSIAEYYNEKPKFDVRPSNEEMGPPKSAMVQPDLPEGGNAPATTTTSGVVPTSSPEELDSLAKMLTEKEAGIKKQRGIDANLALIMAGLGMAGGTSKNALENISKGAQLGLGTYMTGAKQRAQEERDILSSRLGLRRLKGLEDIRAQQTAANLEGKIGSLIGSREKQLEQAAFNNITKTGLMIDSAEGQAAIAREVARLKSQDPFLAKLYRDFGLPPIQSTGAGAPKRSPEDIKKQYNIS